MQHLGDITKISGYTAPIVDCIVGGSPCQDLSVAGKRAGLDGERSGLYIEQVRIVKEMRERDERNGRSGVDVRPRYMVWENVPGAFSSNKGDDFRIVLEELARIVEEGVSIPRPPKGKWQTSGVIIGDGYSIAWRVMDAQHYGVPQRRRRIVLVADFGGHSAPRVVFGDGQHLRGSVGTDSEQTVRHSGSGRGQEVSSVGDRLRGNTPSCGETRKRTAPDAQGGVGADDPEGAGGAVAVGIDGYNATETGNKSATLGVNCGVSTGRNGVIINHFVLDDQGGSQISVRNDGKRPTLRAEMHGNVPCVMCYDARGNGDGHTASTITGDHENRITDYTSVVVESAIPIHDQATRFSGKRGDKSDGKGNGLGIGQPGDPMNTLTSGDRHAVACGINGNKSGTLDASYYKGCGMRSGMEREVVAQSVDCRNCTEDDVNGTLLSNSAHSLNGNNTVRIKNIVRRLTPTECERLQGYPDGWTDIGDWVDSKGKKHKAADSPRYKALGNSIALPVWKIILKRLCACYERDATMASLFDGIGGFPYLWEQINGNGSCLWASEIEEFPMAVTKVRIGE